MILAKIDLENTNIDEDGEDIQLEYLKGNKSFQSRDTHIEIENLEPGEYYLYVEFDWQEATTDTKFVVTFYGESEADFLRDEMLLFPRKRDILEHMFKSKALQEGQKVKIQDMSNYGKENIKKYQAQANDEGYLFVMVKNDDEQAVYVEHCSYEPFTGLTFLEPEKGTAYSIEVQPGKFYVVIMAVGDKGFGYGCVPEIDIQLSESEFIESLRNTGKRQERVNQDNGQSCGIYLYSK